MKKLFTLGALLLLGATVLGPSQGQAFNSGTHVYIADRVFPCTFDKINLYYGSIAPDIALYVDPASRLEAFCQTHYGFIEVPCAWCNLTERAFANGWETHNEIWGADAYAHGTCECFEKCVDMQCIYDGYVPTQAKALADVIASHLGYNLHPDLADFAIEVAIDVLLARYHDPFLGLKLLWAAQYHSGKDVELMEDTFGNAVVAPEGFFQLLVLEYAKALALPDPLRMVALGELGSEVANIYYQVDIDPVQVRWILRIAMYLCQNTDYFGVIESAIEGIHANR